MPSPLVEQLRDALADLYIVERELGGGGMSQVFVAEERALGRRVVIKVLAPHLAEGVSVDRFAREIRLAASLQQANIVPVLTTGSVGSLPYYTMPYVDGRSLRARLADGPMGITEILSVLKDMGRALAYAHDHGVVHRDIKPDNVLLSGGTAVVTDFGIAKAISAARTGGASETGSLTSVGMSIGTPQYIAPEQAAGDPDTDHRADIYAFGCTAYELLTGHAPFDGRTAHKLMTAHMIETPAAVEGIRTDTPPKLAQVVMQCLEKSPDQRPQSAAEIVRALETVTSESTESLPGYLLARQTPLWLAIVYWIAVVGATYVLAKAAIVGIGLPDWVLPGALFIAIAGLPAILLTHYVQRTARRAHTQVPTLTPGGSRQAAGTMATFAIRAAPMVSWRRTWSIGAGLAALFVVVVGSFMALRAMGIGPAGSLLGKGLLKQNDRVVIAQFTAADTSLAGSVTDALRTELSESKAVSVLQPSAIRATLAKMEKADVPVMNATLAREVAQREGAKAVITGEVSTLGAGFLLKAQLIEPASGDPLATFQEIAKDPGEVLAAIGRLSKQVRAKIGESLKTLQNIPPVERVTTSSLLAFRKYNEAIQGSELTAGLVRLDPIQLLKEAIALDTNFAMAYRKLAWLDLDPEKRIMWATKAYALRDHLSDIERYQAEGMYDWVVTQDLDAAIAAHIKAFAVDSTVPRIAGNLTQLYSQAGNWNEAHLWADRLVRFDSANGNNYALPVDISLGRDADVDRLIRAIKPADPDSSNVYAPLVSALWSRRAWDSVGMIVDRHRHLTSPMTHLQVLFYSNMLGAIHGRLRTSLSEFDSAGAVLRSIGVPENPTAPLYRAFFATWFLEDTLRAGAIIDSLVRSGHLDSARSSATPLSVAIVYAQAHRARDAAAWIARYDRAVRDTVKRMHDRDEYDDARGWLALAEGRPRDAVPIFRNLITVGPACHLCARAELALAYDLAQQPDSALALYEPLLSAHDLLAEQFPAFWDAFLLKRIGELYEGKAEPQKALPYYRRFVELWKNADPELQPKVREVRARIDRIEKGQAKGR